MRLAIFESQNRVTQNGVTFRVNNSEFLTEIRLLSD